MCVKKCTKRHVKKIKILSCLIADVTLSNKQNILDILTHKEELCVIDTISNRMVRIPEMLKPLSIPCKERKGD